MEAVIDSENIRVVCFLLLLFVSGLVRGVTGMRRPMGIGMIHRCRPNQAGDEEFSNFQSGHKEK